MLAPVTALFDERDDDPLDFLLKNFRGISRFFIAKQEKDVVASASEWNCFYVHAYRDITAGNRFNQAKAAFRRLFLCEPYRATNGRSPMNRARLTAKASLRWF